MSPSFALDARESIIRLSKRVNAQSRPAETKPDLPLEIAHLLLIDVVGYSKLLVDEEIEYLHELNQIVRSTECFRAAESTGKLIRVPTGDGMALLFFRSPEEPAQCALEISRTLKIIRISRYGWECIAAQSIKLPMSMIGQTLLVLGLTSRSG